MNNILKNTKIKEIMLTLGMILSLTMPMQAGAFDFCGSVSDATKGILSCGGGEQTTFTNFQGGLTAPDTAGYAPALTQAPTARDYIRNVTNFALGFLGLIAVLVIVYGGVLYVTAMGKEDKTEVGKKSITYAVTGLLIIMGSFAIVNTVLQAPSGKENNTLNGAATGGTVSTSDRRAFFNYAAIAVQQIARDFLTAYQNYSEIRTDVLTLINVDLEKQITSPQTLKSTLQNKKNILNNILVKAGSLSQVSEKAQHMLLVYDKYLKISDKAIDEVASEKDPNTYWEQFWYKTNYSTYTNDIKNEAGADTFLDQASQAPGSVEQTGLMGANNQDFAQAVIKAYSQLTELSARIKQASDLPEIQTSFDNVTGDLETLVNKNDLQSEIIRGNVVSLNSQADSILKGLALVFVDVVHAADLSPALPTLKSVPDNAAMLQIVKDMSSLYEKVKDLQFVYSAIHADISQGNAPLVVNLDALKSLDPNNNTIPDNNFTWSCGDNSGEKTGTVSQCIYQNPGTYVVKLKVAAPEDQNNPKKPVDGIVYTTVTVKPPSSRINLQATVNGKSFWMSKYDNNGISLSSIQDLSITTEEAKTGISLDGRETKTGNGLPFNDPTIKNSPVAKVKWDFGDKSNTKNTVEGPPDTISQVQTVKYIKEGSYRVTLEVTDDRGITDRKIFNIVVSSIAARINVTHGNELKLNDQATFDGSASASANSQVKTYDWKIMQLATKGGNSIDLTPPEAKNVDTLKYTFKEPGNYDVSLSVSDGSNDASTVVRIHVVSKPPVAQFSFDNSDKSQPNTYILDGAKSYDPDSSEDIAYRWEFSTAPGNCTYINGKTENDCVLFFKDYSTDKNLSKIKVRLNKGKYTITLSVRDPAEIAKVTTQEQRITVDNDLDVGWGDDGKPITAKLNAGSVDVNFVMSSLNGVSYELDTGDGAKENGSITASPFTVKHTYNKSGSFIAKLMVFDNNNNQNNTIRKVFIASDNIPVAAISLTQDGNDLSDTSSTITANRKTQFVFDAGKSINIDGTGKKLNYSWDLGDGTLSTKKQVTHTFTELTPKDKPYYKITLKVTNQDDATQVSPIDEIHINVATQPPVVQGLTAIPAGTSTTTPVNVNVTANGANDPDGKIVSYRWWYYDIDNPEDQKGLQLSESPNTTIVIGTNGVEGQKKTYGFAVMATDNDNQTFNTQDGLDDSMIPKLAVTNGPNKSPVAKLNVDRTNVMVGDTVSFSSSSTDPDANGSIATYIWDFEGNGFADNVLTNDYNKPNVSYVYTKPYKDGVKVKLKVIDNNGAESISDPVMMYVDAKTAPPVAAFTSQQLDGKKIQFTNNSTADAVNGANLAKYSWDFNLAVDANGDGIKDNDLDSTEQAPTYEYPDYGVFRAKLVVADDQGNQASVINFVNIKAPVLVVTKTQQVTQQIVKPVPVVTPIQQPTQPTQTLQKLEARLTSAPAPSVTDNRIHLQGDSGTVIFNFSDSRGPIKSYIIDKNIYYDSNGNGIKDDDEDYKTTAPGTWTTQFFKSYGQDSVKLTVVDDKGTKSSVIKDIVFDVPNAPIKSQLGVDIFAGTNSNEIPGVLVTIAGFGILFVSMRVLKSKKQK
ncbi:MAG: PKD domain-containing protein [Candidatus Gracilibacteria bacterium]|jgi:PKD repeat protein